MTSPLPSRQPCQPSGCNAATRACNGSFWPGRGKLSLLIACCSLLGGCETTGTLGYTNGGNTLAFRTNGHAVGLRASHDDGKAIITGALDFGGGFAK